MVNTSGAPLTQEQIYGIHQKRNVILLQYREVQSSLKEQEIILGNLMKQQTKLSEPPVVEDDMLEFFKLQGLPTTVNTHDMHSFASHGNQHTLPTKDNIPRTNSLGIQSPGAVRVSPQVQPLDSQQLSQHQQLALQQQFVLNQQQQLQQQQQSQLMQQQQQSQLMQQQQQGLQNTTAASTMNSQSPAMPLNSINPRTYTCFN